MNLLHEHGPGFRHVQFLREVARYALVYDAVETDQVNDDREASSLARMRVVDTQTMTPILLWLFANTDGDVRLNSLRALESYVVRRSLCRLTTKNYNRLFLEILRRVGAGEGRADRVVEEYLTAQTSESGMWPTDVEVKRSFEQLPLYRLLKRDRLQRALLALEQHATTARTEPVAVSRRLSIEHLLPQQWATNWPLPDDPEQAASITNERAEVLHSIGNLTLVTGALNGTLSNAAWPTKRQHLLDHSALTLNRSLPTEWDTNAIRARGAWLADLAVDLWRRPALTDDEAVFAADAERDLRPDSDVEAAAAPPAGDVTRRGDIALHVQHVFADLPQGTFLTIAEIRRRPSPAYPVKPPSAGAISARLFPGVGRTTLVGVVPDTRAGVRGARKADDPNTAG